jgi:hypothetical protein
MKTILLAAVFTACLYNYNANCQTVVNTTGSTIITNEYIFEYSVGEISITTLSGPSVYQTQGLLQPSVKIIDPACQIINDTLNYFPNPTQSMLSVVTRFDWITGYQIYTTDGKLVRNAPFVNNQVDMTNLPAGIYFIKILPGCNNKFRILKAIKQ